MGISNDITKISTRRQVSQTQKINVQNATETPAETPVADLAPPEDAVQPFFNGEEQANAGQSEGRSFWSRLFSKSTFFILFIIVVGSLIYINFAKIKKILRPAAVTTSSTKTTVTKDTSSTTTDPNIKLGNQIPDDPTITTPPTSAETTPTTATPTTTTPAVTPAATPATTIDKASIKIQLLNGNGINGSASAVRTSLQKLGFTISSFGNARSFSYAKTYVYFKTGQDAESALVKDALAGKEVVVEKNDAVTKIYDIVIVVGKT